jgi:hypothetical protein
MECLQNMAEVLQKLAEVLAEVQTLAEVSGLASSGPAKVKN